MHTELNLPKLDEALLNFISQHPTNLAHHSKYDRTYRVGLKYRSLIYRAVFCESADETRLLMRFLFQTGYVKEDQKIPPYDEVLEIVD